MSEKKEKKIRVIYFCDIMGDTAAERDTIQQYLHAVIGLKVKVELWERPPWEERFDILFFDWGGMSMGNSMLDHFCRDILEIAENNPGRVFVMTSHFTEMAMKEALSEMQEKPDNIFLTIEEAEVSLKSFVK